MAISYFISYATAPDRRGPGVVAHACNDSGGRGKGFILAISRHWSEPEVAYPRWARGGEEFELGMVQLVQVEDQLSVANMVAAGSPEGNWDQIEPLLDEQLAMAAFDVCVYDLPTTYVCTSKGPRSSRCAHHREAVRLSPAAFDGVPGNYLVEEGSETTTIILPARGTR